MNLHLLKGLLESQLHSGLRVALVGDISKGFLQISGARKDQDAARFLCIEGHPHGPTNILRMT